MGAPIFYPANRLEVGIVTAGAATGTPVSRLSDRFKGDRWRDSASGTRDIVLDLGSTGLFVDTVIGTEHNLDGLTLTAAHDDNPTFTSPTTLESAAIDSDPFILTGTASAERYWQLRIASAVNPPELGELFFTLGVSCPNSPRSTASPNRTGAIVRQETEAGVLIAAVRGDPYWETDWRIAGVFTRAQRDAFLDMWSQDLLIGARPCFVQDGEGDESSLRFVHVLSIGFEGAELPRRYFGTIQLREALG